jgi:hypothetical protein
MNNEQYIPKYSSPEGQRLFEQLKANYVKWEQNDPDLSKSSDIEATSWTVKCIKDARMSRNPSVVFGFLWGQDWRHLIQNRYLVEGRELKYPLQRSLTGTVPYLKTTVNEKPKSIHQQPAFLITMN